MDPTQTRATLEQRLLTDEARLERDEARLELDEAELRESRIVAWMGIGLVFVLTIAVVALVLAVLALRDDVGSLNRSAPAGSVGTEALQPGAVTADKLAPDAVGKAAIAPASVGAEHLAPDAVSGVNVARNALTGADIREGTLGTVPSARNAERLGGIRASLFLSQPFEITVSGPAGKNGVNRPVTAYCPRGSRVLSGGAAIEGATNEVALVASAPVGERGWTATARAADDADAGWRLVVTAICAAGGR